MKKLLFFIPAICFTVLYGFVALGGIGAIHPIVILFLCLLWGSGILLSKSIIWGGLLGLIPAACLIYLGTQDSGQIVRETPIGLVVFLYYAICIFFAYKKKHS